MSARMASAGRTAGPAGIPGESDTLPPRRPSPPPPSARGPRGGHGSGLPHAGAPVPAEGWADRLGSGPCHRRVLGLEEGPCLPVPRAHITPSAAHVTLDPTNRMWNPSCCSRAGGGPREWTLRPGTLRTPRRPGSSELLSSQPVPPGAEANLGSARLPTCPGGPPALGIPCRRSSLGPPSSTGEAQPPERPLGHQGGPAGSGHTRPGSAVGSRPRRVRGQPCPGSALGRPQRECGGPGAPRPCGGLGAAGASGHAGSSRCPPLEGPSQASSQQRVPPPTREPSQGRCPLTRGSSQAGPRGLAAGSGGALTGPARRPRGSSGFGNARARRCGFPMTQALPRAPGAAVPSARGPEQGRAPAGPAPRMWPRKGPPGQVGAGPAGRLPGSCSPSWLRLIPGGGGGALPAADPPPDPKERPLRPLLPWRLAVFGGGL